MHNQTILIQFSGKTIPKEVIARINKQILENPDLTATIVWYDESQKEQISPGKIVYKQYTKKLKETESFLYELIRNFSR